MSKKDSKGVFWDASLAADDSPDTLSNALEELSLPKIDYNQIADSLINSSVPSGNHFSEYDKVYCSSCMSSNTRYVGSVDISIKGQRVSKPAHVCNSCSTITLGNEGNASVQALQDAIKNSIGADDVTFMPAAGSENSAGDLDYKINECVNKLSDLETKLIDIETMRTHLHELTSEFTNILFEVRQVLDNNREMSEKLLDPIESIKRYVSGFNLE